MPPSQPITIFSARVWSVHTTSALSRSKPHLLDSHDKAPRTGLTRPRTILCTQPVGSEGYPRPPRSRYVLRARIRTRLRAPVDMLTNPAPFRRRLRRRIPQARRDRPPEQTRLVRLESQPGEQGPGDPRRRGRRPRNAQHPRVGRRPRTRRRVVPGEEALARGPRQARVCSLLCSAVRSGVQVISLAGVG